MQWSIFDRPRARRLRITFPAKGCEIPKVELYCSSCGKRIGRFERECKTCGCELEGIEDERLQCDD